MIFSVSRISQFPLQATDEGCKANGYIEIISDDATSEDRYCGAYLATASESGDEQTNGSKSPGVIYGIMKNYTIHSILITNLIR